MTDKPNHVPGALRANCTIELHSQYAINTWTGRPASPGKSSLIGIPSFFGLLARINRDSLADNPWADAALLAIEKQLVAGSQQMQRWLDEINELIVSQIPSAVKMSLAASNSPSTITVHSQTPLGYRCVYLLVGFDQLILRVFQASHYGLISLQTRKQWLSRGSNQIRRVLMIALRYKSVPVTRRDIALGNDAACHAIALLGNVSKEILLGEERCSFSAPVDAESIQVLRAVLNSQTMKSEVEM